MVRNKKLVSVEKAFPMGIPPAVKREITSLRISGRRDGRHVVIGSGGRVFVKMRE